MNGPMLRCSSLLLLLAGLPAGPAHTQTRILTDAPLVGRVVEGGTLAPDAMSTDLLLDLPAGQGMEITILAAGAFDPVLTVYPEESDEQMAFDDDSGGDLNPRVAVFSSERQRVRLVVARSGNQDGTGPGGRFNVLLLDSAYRPNTPLAIERSGQRFEGEVSSGNPQLFTLPGHAQSTWEFILVANQSSLDAFLEVLGPSSAEPLASDDDSAGSLNSRLTFTFPQAGEYTIRATGLGSSPGAYLFVARDITGGAEQDTATIGFSAPVAGELNLLAPVRSFRLDDATIAQVQGGPAILEVRLTGAGADTPPTLAAGFNSPLGTAMTTTGTVDYETGVTNMVLPFSQGFTADDDWLRNLVIQVSNQSAVESTFTLQLTRMEPAAAP